MDDRYVSVPHGNIGEMSAVFHPRQIREFREGSDGIPLPGVRIPSSGRIRNLNKEEFRTGTKQWTG
jgi:hypothetical protein